MRDWSISTPSMRLDAMVLWMSAFSRRTFRICGDWCMKSSYLPLASPRSARYHDVAVGIAGRSLANCLRVIMERFLTRWLPTGQRTFFSALDGWCGRSALLLLAVAEIVVDAAVKLDQFLSNA